jgi:hypothetical protein
MALLYRTGTGDRASLTPDAAVRIGRLVVEVSATLLSAPHCCDVTAAWRPELDRVRSDGSPLDAASVLLASGHQEVCTDCLRHWSGCKLDTDTLVAGWLPVPCAGVVAAYLQCTPSRIRVPPKSNQNIERLVALLRDSGDARNVIASMDEAIAPSAPTTAMLPGRQVAITAEPPSLVASEVLRVASAFTTVDRRKMADASVALRGALQQQLAASPPVAGLVDPARCLVLHSRERVPFLLAPRNEQVRPVIVKGADDVLLECAVIELIRVFNAVWRASAVDIEAVEYGIVPCLVPSDTGAACELPARKMVNRASSSALVAFMECLPGASLHDLRVAAAAHGRPAVSTESDGSPLKKRHGPPAQGSPELVFTEQLGSVLVGNASRRACFLRTYTGACIVSAVLRLKDRHNANILFDASTGSWSNVDFAFAMGRAPGGAMNVESAAFKLPDAVLNAVFGGATVYGRALTAAGKEVKTPPNVDADERCGNAAQFAAMLVQGMAALKNHFTEVVRRVLILPPALLEALADCSRGTGNSVGAQDDAARVLIILWESIRANAKEVLGWAAEAANHSGTARYDAFQLKSNGIM